MSKPVIRVYLKHNLDGIPRAEVVLEHDKPAQDFELAVMEASTKGDRLGSILVDIRRLWRDRWAKWLQIKYEEQF